MDKGSTKRINGVTQDESDLLLPYLINLVTPYHDAQARFKQRKNDIEFGITEVVGIVQRMTTELRRREIGLVC